MVDDNAGPVAVPVAVGVAAVGVKFRLLLFLLYCGLLFVNNESNPGGRRAAVVVLLLLLLF